MAATDCSPAAPAAPSELAERTLAIGSRAEPHALHAAAAAAAAAALADRAGGDQARRNDHVQPAGRAVADRELDPFLTLAAGDHVEIAGLAGLEEIDRLGRHRGWHRGGLGIRPRPAAASGRSRSTPR